jgi:hypothetical protein
VHFIRFVFIVAGLILIFTYRPFLYMAIGGAVVFMIMKGKEEKEPGKASEAGKKTEDTEVPPK